METIYELNSFGEKYYLIIQGVRSIYISYEKVKELLAKGCRLEVVDDPE